MDKAECSVYTPMGTKCDSNVSIAALMERFPAGTAE